MPNSQPEHTPNIRIQDSPMPVYVVSPGPAHDQIKLIDLWCVIWQQKMIVILAFGIGIVCAFGYASFATPVYLSEIHLLPPRTQNIQALMIDHRGRSISVKENDNARKAVYVAALGNIQSRDIRRKFFEQNNLLSYFTGAVDREKVNSTKVFEEQFNKKLKVKRGTDNPLLVMLSLEYSDPERLAAWLNEFAEFASKETVQQIYDDINTSIQFEILKIQDSLQSKLKLANKRRVDERSRLLEALAVAKSLGIVEGSIQRENWITSSDKGLTVNTAQIPAYMRGVKALETEISVLDSRKSDEPFISGFRDLQEQKIFLESISIDTDQLSALTIVSRANIPYAPERPRKVLILLLGAILGMMAGILLAFLKKSKSSNP